ncbi:LysE family translocator [Rubrobacter indicoceani]|uniref:LysE family translocator n=1 Tax=Rubrobacter indicoceani TaxID=2051957 RepID=UPI000E5C37C7|nr:LysE family translocator [Rubrobacter indicoceani]
MPDAATFLLFIAATVAFLVFPGPSVFYIVTRSVSEGRAAGLASVLGVQTGTFVHILFATVGLSAIVATSAVAFSVVKWLGVAYLVYLGISQILSGSDDPDRAAVRPAKLSKAYLQGIMVNVLNPKTALFFLAFLPQFVSPANGAVWTQILILGVTLAAVGVVTDGTYALLGSTAGRWLRGRSGAFRRRQRYIVGGLYIALGVAAAAWRRAA